MSALEKLDYFFDKEGVLRTKSNNALFKFTDQEAYETLGEAVDEEVYNLLEKRCNLIRTSLKPAGATDNDEDVSFIFVSENCLEKETLLVLLHGSGVVRAGQWARRLIINNDLECGTQIPYIERALEKDWGVVVLNTNHTSSQDEELKYSRTPKEHAMTAWKEWAEKSKADRILVVAHSRGGADVSHVMKTYGGDERIDMICLTDSWFDYPQCAIERKTPLLVFNFLARNGDLSKEVEKNEVVELPAGTKIHEWTSYCSMEAIFFLFESKICPNDISKEILAEAKKLLRAEKPKNTDDDEPEAKKKRV